MREHQHEGTGLLHRPRSATLTLQKGVYTLIVEANLHYTDGTVQYVRNADHNTPSEALAWMDDRSAIVLLLKYVN